MTIACGAIPFRVVLLLTIASVAAAFIAIRLRPDNIPDWIFD